MAHSPHFSHFVVTHEVEAVQAINTRSTIDITTGDRSTFVVLITRYRINIGRTAAFTSVTGLVVAFTTTPAVVSTFLDNVNFLKSIFTYVSQPNITSQAVEAPTPGVT